MLEGDATVPFRGEVWLYQAEKAAWHFVTVPKEEAARIRFFAGDKRRGWGSVRVVVTIGATRWKTSVFPDSKTGTYLLPLKVSVRRAEGFGEGDRVEVSLRVDGV